MKEQEKINCKKRCVLCVVRRRRMWGYGQEFSERQDFSAGKDCGVHRLIDASSGRYITHTHTKQQYLNRPAPDS